jgi:riboflavin synthase
VSLGDSISNNGVCLTVVAISKNGFSADVSQEILNALILPAIKRVVRLTLKKPYKLRVV